MKYRSIILLLVILLGPAFAFAKDPDDPRKYALTNPNYLTFAELQKYYEASGLSQTQATIRAQTLLSQFDPNGAQVPMDRIFKYDNLEVGKGGIIQKVEKRSWEPLGFLNRPKPVGNFALGPIRLRKDADGWNAALTEAEGAKFNYSNDRQAGSHEWSAQGALIYPISRFSRGKDDGLLASHHLQFLPAASWHVVDLAESQTNDVQELKFQIPMAWTANLQHLGPLIGADVSLTPYYQTDFSFKGAIEGASLEVVPVLRFSDDPAFSINDLYRGLPLEIPLRYRLGVKPGLDFNHLSSTSRFITRQGGEDYTRLTTAFEVGLRTNPTASPSIEVLGTYRCFVGLTGAPDYADLLTAKATIWFNDNVGLSAEFNQGKTPVAQKDIDLFTLGLEVKF